MSDRRVGFNLTIRIKGRYGEIETSYDRYGNNGALYATKEKLNDVIDAYSKLKHMEVEDE